MPTYGVIDLGSNSIRLVIYEVKDDRRSTYSSKDFKSIINDKVMAGLAAFVEDGVFTSDGVDRAVNVLRSHMKRVRYFGCKRVDVFATAVLRNAVNCAEAVAEIERRCGLAVTLLSARDEAHLGFVGARCSTPLERGTLVDIGGGSTDIAVISMGGRVKAASVPVAGNAFDRCIAQYVQEKFQIAIGPLTAEALKKQVACCTKSEFEGVMEVRGHSWETNLPARHVIYTRDLYEPVQELASRIAAAARAVLESTPPELAADVSSSGVLLTGGGSLLRGLASYIAGELHVDVAIAPDPLNCVARGTAISLSEGCYLTAGFRDATPKAWHKRLQNNHDPFAGE